MKNIQYLLHYTVIYLKYIFGKNIEHYGQIVTFDGFNYFITLFLFPDISLSMRS